MSVKKRDRNVNGERSSKVTIVDVARHAGVSHTTVSWVIHDDPRITPETKERVHASIRALNYHPNLSARRLVRGRSDTVAMMAAFFSGPFEMEILKGVEDGMSGGNEGKAMNLFTTGGSDSKVRTTMESILYGDAADGLILLSIVPPDDLVAAFRERGRPLVVIDGKVPGACSITSDNEYGARMATAHLLQRGYRHLAIVNGHSSREDPHPTAEERLTGYIETLGEWGIPYNPAHSYEVFHYDYHVGLELGADVAKGGYDAVFCGAGDAAAMGLMSAFREKGLRIPEDIALVGYDDWYPARLLSPSMTTVAQPLREMGKRALLECIKGITMGAAAMKDGLYDPKLIVRQSS